MAKKTCMDTIRAHLDREDRFHGRVLKGVMLDKWIDRAVADRMKVSMHHLSALLVV